MADDSGVPKTVGVAPEGPGGQDDVVSKPNPEGPDKVYDVSADDSGGYLVALEVDAMIKIQIQNMQFVPNFSEIFIGDSVQWSNDDDGVTHTAAANDGSWDTGALNSGTTSKPIVFSKAGTYAYHCAYHPEMMKATLIVAATRRGVSGGDD